MSLNYMRVLGIDVAKAKLDVALLLPDGKFRSEVVANTPEGFDKLAAWLERHGAAQVHACMEATGIYWESAAEFLTGRIPDGSQPCRERDQSGPDQRVQLRCPEPHQNGQKRRPPHRPLLRGAEAAALGAATRWSA